MPQRSRTGISGHKRHWRFGGTAGRRPRAHAAGWHERANQIVVPKVGHGASGQQTGSKRPP